MIGDLTSKLRELAVATWTKRWPGDFAVQAQASMTEAADEIDRLNAELDALREQTAEYRADAVAAGFHYGGTL